jgi:pimeloyl-ACP methyl ester carboxylesterase
MRRSLCVLFLVATMLLVPVFAATVDGLKVHWASAGNGKQTVILIHGWTCDSSSWAYQLPALSKKYRVITLDLPGHGQSASPADGKFTSDLFARAVESVRAEAKAEKAVLIGHSMGVPVIRQYAGLYPAHVAGLIAVDGPLVRPDWAGANGGRGLPPPTQFAGPEGLKARENMVRGMFTSKTPMDLQQKILDMMLKAPESTATGAFRWILDPDIWPQGALTVPALAIYAGTASAQTMEDTKKRVSGLEATQIPGTGHFLMMEQPEKFNELVMTFIDKLKF